MAAREVRRGDAGAGPRWQRAGAADVVVLLGRLQALRDGRLPRGLSPRPVRRARRAAGDAASRHRHDGRERLRPGAHERGRHPRLLPCARRRPQLQPAAESRGADGAARHGVDARWPRWLPSRLVCRPPGVRGIVPSAPRAAHEREPLVKESRLDELREEAKRTGRVDAKGVHALGSPMPAADQVRGYYNLPVLKEPVWTWEVPAYFFVGGAAGASAAIAAAARLFGREDVVSDARWVAAAGARLATPLLIADLGRPERFLNMLRVFKVQSPMS